jgi:hypothetical protein
MKTDILVSRYFVISLILLLLNDFFFKGLFHNAITGKLSDVAGLFIFPIVCSYLMGWKKSMYVFTLIFFVFWKTPYSEPLISFWNSFGIFQINRVVDYSDLIALFILPVSYYYNPKPIQKGTVVKYCNICILLLSCFSFMATAGTTGKIDEVSLSNNKHEVYNAIQILLNDNPALNVPNALLKEPISAVPLDRNNTKYSNKNVSDSTSFHFYLPENVNTPVIWFEFRGGKADWASGDCSLILYAASNKYGNRLYEKDLDANQKKKIRAAFKKNVTDKLDSILNRN